MTDMISKKDFKINMKRLEVAFIKEIPGETIEMYWEFTKNINQKVLVRAINNIIKEEHWFPSIAKIIEYTNPDNDFEAHYGGGNN